MTARKSISWILEFTSKLPNNTEKVKCLRANDDIAIKTVLKYMLDPEIKWALPDSDPPYVPTQEKAQTHVLYGQMRKMYHFLVGGNPDLNQIKREAMFIDVLQSCDPEDAKLVLAMKNKKMPYEGLSNKVVLEAFPGLF